MRKIIDVSEFNGLIDWAQAAPHIDGAILRAGYRGYGSAGTLVRDSQFAKNLIEIKRLKIPWGAYFLTQAVSESEAQAEADFVQSVIGDTAPLGVWLDSEYGEPNALGRADRLSKAARTAFAMAFLREAKRLGQTAGLYCAADWYRTVIDGASIKAAGFKVWLASVENVKPSVPYDCWQYTWLGSVPGIKGNVDISFFSDEIGGKSVSKYYTDTNGHWAEKAIDRMRDEGLMNGKTETTFAPDAPITRAEIATVFSRLLDKLDGK